MRKILVLLLLLASVALVSCNAETPNGSTPNESENDVSTHVHEFSGEVKFDEIGHFTACECGEVSRGEHIMEDNEVKKITDCVEAEIIKCKDCEYTVEAKVSKISHIYKDEVCTKCGSHEPSGEIAFEFRDEYGWIAIYKGLDGEEAAITELYIPAYTDTGEKVVGVDGFGDLSGLKKVVIPKGVKYLLSNSFQNCTSLEKIEYEGTIEDWKNIEVSDTALNGTSVKRVFCSDGIVELFDSHTTTAKISNRSNLAKI